MLGRLGSDAAKLATATVDACVALDNSIQEVELDASTYPAMSEPADLTSLLRTTRLEEQARSRGIVELLSQLKARIQINDVAGARMLEEVAETLALEVLSTPRPKLESATSRDGDIDKKVNAARETLALVRRAREARKPAELATAMKIRANLLVPAFALVVGVNAWTMPDAKFQRILDGSESTPGPWSLDPDWLARQMVPLAWPPAMAPSTSPMLLKVSR